MSGVYKNLLQLSIRHNYFKTGATRDISIVPLPQTLKLAKQYKLLFRQVGNNMNVLSLMTGANTPLHDLGNNNKLSFALFLKNPELFNITKLPTKQNSRQIYHIENSIEARNIILPRQWTLADPRPDSFNYSYYSYAQAVTLKTTDPFGTSDKGNMRKEGNQFLSFFSLGSRTEGKYIFETTEDGGKKATEAIYISEFLWKARPFLIMDIFTDKLTYDSPTTYFIRIGARRVTTWTYLVNLNKDYTGSTITIEDTRQTPEVLFKVIGDPSQANGKTLTFKAYKAEAPDQEAKIRLNEAPVSDFKLVIEKNGTKTEIAGLPNPPINQVKSEMHINI